MTEEHNTAQTINAAEKLNFYSRRSRGIAISLLVILLVTFLSYLPTLKNDFIFLDDDSHLLDNSAVRVLDMPHVKEIFTTTVNSTYIPLSLLSFAVEHHFFKYDPFIYHLNNLLLHLGVTALVFYFAMQVGLPLGAAFAASLIFGIHPMHVESISWVTERKDVLYSFFYMGALCFYWLYLSRSKKGSVFYTASVLCGLLSILAKPMALSLPLILFICDWLKRRRFDKWMTLDKIPHFFYVIPIAWITFSLNTRILSVNLREGVLIWFWTCVFYVQKFLLPVSFVPRYEPPDPVSFANPQYFAAVCLFILITCILVRWRRQRWLMFAALFYFFSIFFLLRYNNVVDDDVVADRFMYLPCMGICFLIGYGVDQLFEKAKGRPVIVKTLLIVILLLLSGWLGAKTFAQTKIWRSSIPFWSYVIRHYPGNAMAYGNRGEAYKDQGKYKLAIVDFNKSILVDPEYAESYNSRGQMYAMSDRFEEALEDFRKAIELRPNFDDAYNNIGVLYTSQGKLDEAISYFEQAAKISPFNDDAIYNVGNYYYIKGQFEPAFDSFQKVIVLNPASVIAYNKRGLIYGIRKEYDLAIRDFDKALALDPGNSEFYKNKGIILEHMKVFDEAIENYNKALEINPVLVDAICFRGNAYAQTGRYGEAAKDFTKALEIDPDHQRAKISQNALIRILTGQKREQNINTQEILRDKRKEIQRISDIEQKIEGSEEDK